ncbi:hypothetical protein [Citromicrobium bathyomarinum]|uniref:hypothetical protein n=1 Tax=Citromicrobium bathyomarinum TaxID=72174 RepID=UPI0031599825
MNAKLRALVGEYMPSGMKIWLMKRASRDDGFEALHHDEHLRVTRLADDADSDAHTVFVCFTGIKQGLGGLGAEEFVGSTRREGHTALFVSDLQRSWYNGFPPEHLQTILRPYVEGRRVITLGNSMGGFGAIWAAQWLGAERAIAFAPQFSVHPDIVPGETRWTEWRNRISEWRVPSLLDSFADGTDYFVFHGDADSEHYHQFPERPNILNVVIADSGHGPAAKLKEAGVLGEVFAQCLSGKDPRPTIREAGLTLKPISSDK